MHALILQGKGSYYVSAVFGCYRTKQTEEDRKLQRQGALYYVVFDPKKKHLIKWLAYRPNTKYIEPQILIVDADQHDWIDEEDGDGGGVNFLPRGLADELIERRILPSYLLLRCRRIDRAYQYKEYREIETQQDITNLMWATSNFHDAYIDEEELREDGTLYLLFRDVWGCSVEVWFWGDLAYDTNSLDPELVPPYWVEASLVKRDDFLYFYDSDKDIDKNPLGEQDCWFKARHMRYHIIPEYPELPEDPEAHAPVQREKVTVTLAQMQRIARYELTFDQLGVDLSALEDSLAFPENYSYSLEDLEQALTQLQQKDPNIDVLVDNWVDPLMRLGEHFGLDTLLWAQPDDAPEQLQEFAEILPVSDRGVFQSIWNRIGNLSRWIGKDIPLSEFIHVGDLLDKLASYKLYRGKPIEQWKFNRGQMESYIAWLENDVTFERATQHQLSLCRTFVEELCAMDSVRALHTKGYACYGGNELYPCDWNASRDCIARLFELTDSPKYANTLGYLYYYGRCDNGVPDYARAFSYFTMAAANGLYEASYKLADMYCNGYGCKKSLRTARNLYDLVYYDSLQAFLKGEDANFADAALRMSNVYAQGIAAEKSPEQAYFYALQAEYAAKLRVANSDFFGHQTVLGNIETALEEIKPQLPEQYFQDDMVDDEPKYFKTLVKDRYRCNLKRWHTADGAVVLTATRREDQHPANILITVPERSFCERSTSCSYQLIAPSEIWFLGDGSSVIFTSYRQDYPSKQIRFFHYDTLVATVTCDGFHLLVRDEAKLNQEAYRMAGVQFEAFGKVYDYICDFEAVKPGDRVIVPTSHGDTKVLVDRVTTKLAGELPLPLERYKRVVGLAETAEEMKDKVDELSPYID